MENIKNIASVNGVYNNTSFELNSNEVSVDIINSFIFIKSANKDIWATGNLLFTIEVNSITKIENLNIIITDVLDSNLISLVTGSLLINNVPGNNYSYDINSGLLTINLENVTLPVIINFEVKKRNIDIFKLENTAYLEVIDNISFSKSIDKNRSNNAIISSSNMVTVFGLAKISKCIEKKNFTKNATKT